MIETEPPHPAHALSQRRTVAAILSGDPEADAAVLRFAAQRSTHTPSRLRVVVHLDGAGAPYEEWSTHADDAAGRIRPWIESHLDHHDLPYELTVRPHRFNLADAKALRSHLLVASSEPHSPHRLLASLRARRLANQSGRPVVLVAPDWPRRPARWFVPLPHRGRQRVIDLR